MCVCIDMYSFCLFLNEISSVGEVNEYNPPFQKSKTKLLDDILFFPKHKIACCVCWYLLVYLFAILRFPGREHFCYLLTRLVL